MELIEHIVIIKKSKKFIIAFTLLVAVLAFLFSYFRPVTTSVSISFAVKRINKQQTLYYDDSYFGIQASDLFSQTVISWFLTPSVLLNIYDKAGIDPQITSLDRFVSRFKAKKYSAQNIVVRFTERNRETAEKLAEAITAVVEDKAASLNQTADNKAVFEVDIEKPVVVENKPNLYLNTIVGLISGLIVSFALVYLFRYFVPQNKLTGHEGTTSAEKSNFFDKNS